MAARGIPQEYIAPVFSVSESTLKRRCKTELHLGALEATAMVAAVAYAMATSGEDGAMTRFWLRARGGWRDYGDVPRLSAMTFSKVEGDDW